MKLSLKPSRKPAVSPVIATLLLIAIAVAAAIIVYAFVTGLIGSLSTVGYASMVQVTGGLTLPTGEGAGTLVLDIKNSASNPITSVTVIVDSANGITGNVYSGATSFPTGTPFYIFGPGEDLPIGESTSAAAAFHATSGLVAGHTYTFTITIDFTPGTSAQVQELSLTAGN
jgi:FlaG/FlaF family flagellin (archaellin)